MLLLDLKFLFMSLKIYEILKIQLVFVANDPFLI